LAAASKHENFGVRDGGVRVLALDDELSGMRELRIVVAEFPRRE
jgi:hypothetical protein